MTVKIYFDNQGQIVSILKTQMGENTPPTDIFPIPGYKVCDIELTDEQARLPLMALHANYGLNLTEKLPRLVPLEQLNDAFVRRKLTALETEKLLEALQEVAQFDPDAWEEIKADPRQFLKSREIIFPEDIDVFFEDRPIPEPPAIDFEQFGITGWRCFKWCVSEVEDGKPTMVRCHDVCLPIFMSRLE